MLDHGAARLAPIAGADLPAVGAFLHTHLNGRLSASDWAAAAVPTWPVDSPNHGFVLRDGERVVGVQLAFYSRREVDGRAEDFCNLGAWCVLEGYRSQGLRLLRAVLAQRGYHFTDLSPSGNVVNINTRLRFERLDTTTALVPHLVLPRPGGARVVSEPDEVASRLSGTDRQIHRDHRASAATLHVVLVTGTRRAERQSYVVLRRDRRKGLPVFASVLHVGDPAVARVSLGALGRHLLVHHGLLATLVELRHLGARPPGGLVLRTARPKMFRSPLPATAIDDLYSELALVAW